MVIAPDLWSQNNINKEEVFSYHSPPPSPTRPLLSLVPVARHLSVNTDT